jgi:hypothetical protein
MLFVDEMLTGFPAANDLLTLEVEELAGILLIHLSSCEGVCGNSINQNGGISHHNFFNSPNPGNASPSPEYGPQQEPVNRALMEAWAWLQSAGLLVEKASSNRGWFLFHAGDEKSCHGKISADISMLSYYQRIRFTR